MWDYSDRVKDHFLNPRNVGEVVGADGVGEVGSLACGDMLRLTFKLDDAGRIGVVKFKTFGCASAIASSSALTEIVTGMTLDEAAKVTNQDIAEYLGGLPEQKMHCSVMGREALEAAIEYYRSGGKKSAKRELEGDVVCVCFGVTEREIERVVRENGLRTVEQVTNYTKAGGGCGGCAPKIEAIIERVSGERKNRPVEKTAPGKLTNLQKIALVQETIEREIRPALRQDGGDLELIDVDRNVVTVSFRGACASCRVAEFTLKDVVEAKLREFVDAEIEVKEEKL